MKYPICLIISLFSFFAASAQAPDFTDVDNFASSIGYYSPDTLSKMLTQPYNTELKKVRSIFYWITKHISYDFEKASTPRYFSFRYTSKKDSANKRREFVKKTISLQKGVCQDYAELFTTLCFYAKIKSEVVVGYARSFSDSIGEEKSEDHAWNSVMIDNKWYLLDATWAAGYTSGSSHKYTQKFNDYYFLTDPETMKLNHYPTDNKWLLTKDPMTLDQFFGLPTIYFDMADYKISRFQPQTGIINARLGSRLNFTFEVNDTTKKIELVAYPSQVTNPDYTNSYTSYNSPPAIPSAPKRHYIQANSDADDIYNYINKQKGTKATADVATEHTTANKNTVTRTYFVNYAGLQAIQVYYNDELMLQYNVKIAR